MRSAIHFRCQSGVGQPISNFLSDVGTISESCMCMGDAPPQVEATRAGKMLGTLAMSFENITDFEGVLVQGKVAQEGEATPAASQCTGNMSHLPAAVMHRIRGLSAESFFGHVYLAGWPVPSLSISVTALQ